MAAASLAAVGGARRKTSVALAANHLIAIVFLSMRLRGNSHITIEISGVVQNS